MSNRRAEAGLKPAPRGIFSIIFMNPVFPYSGGKRRMLKYILPVIPQHDTYIEPFAGGLAVFLAKERAKVEVINDLNDEVSGFYLYVR